MENQKKTYKGVKTSHYIHIDMNNDTRGGFLGTYWRGGGLLFETVRMSRL